MPGSRPATAGVHGGYWALREGRPDLAGSTVHLVDPGIDTGGILAQTTFTPDGADSIATYPFLHLACAIPLLLDQVDAVLAGSRPVTVPPLPGAERSAAALAPDGVGLPGWAAPARRRHALTRTSGGRAMRHNEPARVVARRVDDEP